MTDMLSDNEYAIVRMACFFRILSCRAFALRIIQNVIIHACKTGVWKGLGAWVSYALYFLRIIPAAHWLIDFSTGINIPLCLFTIYLTCCRNCRTLFKPAIQSYSAYRSAVRTYLSFLCTYCLLFLPSA